MKWTKAAGDLESTVNKIWDNVKSEDEWDRAFSQLDKEGITAIDIKDFDSDMADELVNIFKGKKGTIEYFKKLDWLFIRKS